MAGKKKSNVIVASTSTAIVPITANAIIADENALSKKSSLDDVTKFIKGVEKAMTRNYLQIALSLALVKKTELYTQGNFKSVYDYAQKIFGYKRDMVSKAIRVAENFLDTVKFAEGGIVEHSKLVNDNEKDYSFGGLIELLLLKSPLDDAKQMINDGELNTEMTTSQIRAAVKAKKGIIDKKAKNEKIDDSAKIDKDAENHAKNYDAVKNLNNQFNENYSAVKSEIDAGNVDNEEIADKMIQLASAHKQVSEIALTGGNVEISVYLEKIDALEKENKKLSTEKSELEKLNDKLFNDNVNLNEKVDSQAGEINALKARIEKLQKLLAMTTSQLIDAEKKNYSQNK